MSGDLLAWAVEGDFDPKTLKSNLFEVEWPPRSGKTPIVSRGRLCGIVRAAGGARENLAGQPPFLNRLERLPLSPLE
jgi:predicted NUDIX family NTP pyrophosphohydrolase